MPQKQLTESSHRHDNEYVEKVENASIYTCLVSMMTTLC